MWRRPEQDSWSGIVPDQVGPEFYFDPDTNQLRIKLSGALTNTPDGALWFRTDDSIVQEPGSPVTAKTVVRQSVVERIEATATGTRDTLESVRVALLTEIVDRAAADAVLQAEIDALGPSGGAAALDVVVDFGSTFTHYATVVVTGETWVTATSKIVAMPSGGNPMENAIMQFSPVVSDLVVGDGFTLSVYTPAKAKGTYTFSCLGV